ncbi:mitochondrial Complex1_LYR family protein [Andalucia godoyi]|uniref:Mitochondrial Complex1_LYR family protein n=1 Tax=Andalucia godoyi TaxID=505711 RepID=A0A8K0AH64_ANDGO|nr:mitochondrial Complex1_LYR family protein [Andalucia godoyi]|eukprot:ANDGO_03315.mRNA.1 mitochondrial Complex1_LYR family protein
MGSWPTVVHGRGRGFLPGAKSLRYFMLQSQAIALYRRVCRCTAPRSLADRALALDIRRQARSEFEANRNVVDEFHMRTLLADGHARLKQLKQCFHLVE